MLLPGFCLTPPLYLGQKWPETVFNSRENALNVVFSTWNFTAFPWKLYTVHCTRLGTKILLGSFLTQQLKSQSQSQLQTTNTHTHTHAHTYRHTQCWLISDRTKTFSCRCTVTFPQPHTQLSNIKVQTTSDNFSKLHSKLLSTYLWYFLVLYKYYLLIKNNNQILFITFAVP